MLSSLLNGSSSTTSCGQTMISRSWISIKDQRRLQRYSTISLHTTVSASTISTSLKACLKEQEASESLGTSMQRSRSVVEVSSSMTLRRSSASH